MSAQEIVFDGLSLGMKIVGDLYERNERFVTDMLKAAKTMDKVMLVLTPLLEGSGASGGLTGTVIMGLVRGNTQDIGKNLVCLMLKANGFRVIDLGKNVKPEQFVEAAERESAIAIGMSVMTTFSTVYVEKVKTMLDEAGAADKYPLMSGGAAMSRGVAKRIGVKYGIDANAAVAMVKERAKTAAAIARSTRHAALQLSLRHMRRQSAMTDIETAKALALVCVACGGDMRLAPVLTLNVVRARDDGARIALASQAARCGHGHHCRCAVRLTCPNPFQAEIRRAFEATEGDGSAE